jgi:hypothetical protein
MLYKKQTTTVQCPYCLAPVPGVAGGRHITLFDPWTCVIIAEHFIYTCIFMVDLATSIPTLMDRPINKALHMLDLSHSLALARLRFPGASTTRADDLFDVRARAGDLCIYGAIVAWAVSKWPA